MASIANDPNRRKRILFTDGDGERKAIRLGVVSVKDAASFRLRVEAILSDKALNHPHDGELCEWLQDLPDETYAKMVRVGLVEPRERAEAVMLGALLDRFHAAAVVKATTQAAYRQTTGSLREYFGVEKPVESVTTSDADEWRRTIADSGLATATVAKRVTIAKSVFRKAIRWGIIPTSPFADLRAGSQSNADRSHYVSPETIGAILAACPGEEWRAIVGLSRFAGLRCPSEIRLLRWGDVNWERGRLTVRSPKTAGHDGHAVRVVPIAPELRPILHDLFDAAEPGTEAVVPRLGGRAGGSANLRTTYSKIIAKAGERPWPRLFHNMRASCATDWVERFPGHVVAGWLGHSPLIAARHYLQTRDVHFDLATGATGAALESCAKCGAPAAQNAAQHPTAPDCTGSPESLETSCFAGVSQPGANECEAATGGNNGRNRTRTCDFIHVTDAL